jgi:TorA maturation chaperone TorD
MSAVVEGFVATEEDAARANLYGLLARLLYVPPDAALLQAIASADEIAAPESPLAASWHGLQAASEVMNVEAAEEEYGRLFIGLGQGEVMPYLSWHLTGFLMEEPLAKLRDDLAELGLARAVEVSEPEDHIAALCEVMRWLATGDAETAPGALARQRAFFARHLQPWYARFADALEAAPSANYYRAVARLLKDFLDIEAQAFDIGG